MAMLVLSRKSNQRILIGDGIGVVVLEIRGNQVRLGLEAPAEIQILREEIALRSTAARLPREGRKDRPAGLARR
jgi:carbon storage regulator CsrA